MGERKVLNKYYPPDFDPAKLPKLKVPKDRQYVVRLMAPFTMRCLTCGNYVYKGKKFNARKETALGEIYLGIQIYRFYIRCPKCLQEITFKTDPENTDYSVENGAYRTFQANKLSELEEERLREEKEEEEANNPMLALENRTAESRREMDVLDALEEIRDWNARNSQVKFEDLMERHVETEQTEMEEVEKREQEEARRLLQERRERLRRLEDTTEESVTKPEPKKAKMSQEQKVRHSSKQKLVGLVKRKAQEAGSKEPQPSGRDGDTGQECLVSNSEMREQATGCVSNNELREKATGGCVALEADQTSPAASSSLEPETGPIGQDPRHMSTTPGSGLRGAVVSGSLGLLGAYSDSDESD